MHRVQLVIPCYNEAARFDANEFARFVETQPGASFVMVNDGSTDATLEHLSAFASRHRDRVTVIDQQPNQGKAEAVRRGMLAAFDSDSDFVGYWDADLATPLAEIQRFVEVFERYEDTDLVLGARVAVLGHHIERNAFRHYAGRVFATAASTVLAIPVYDTQCGAKLMRRTERMRALFDQPFGSGWVFDVELLARYLASTGSGDGIRELPLERWTDVAGSKVRPADLARALRQLLHIHRRYRLTGRSPAPRGAEPPSPV